MNVGSASQREGNAMQCNLEDERCMTNQDKEETKRRIEVEEVQSFQTVSLDF